MEYMNNGVGVSTPLDKCKNETKVSTPRKKNNGTEVTVPDKFMEIKESCI